MQYCQNNPKNSYTERKFKHKTSGYARCSICSFDDTENKRHFYWGKDCIEKLYKDLKEFGTEINNFKKKEMIPLTNKKLESYENQKVCYICEKNLCDDKYKKSEYDLYHKVRDHCHYTGKFRAAAHNGSIYDYHFVIKIFKGELECLGENTETYITFSVPLKRENDNNEKITYKLKFIDSYRFMSTSLSNLADNLSGVCDKECKNV